MTRRKPPSTTGEDYDARLAQARAEGDQLKQKILDEVVARSGSAGETGSRGQSSVRDALTEETVPNGEVDHVARRGFAEETSARAEVLHPPRGYWIGVLGRGLTDGMIGPYATEDEAREALAEVQIYVTGMPAYWHETKD